MNRRKGLGKALGRTKLRGFLFPQKKIKVKVIEEQDFQTNVTPQSVKLTVNDVGFEFHLLTMHSISIDPQNIQQEQKHSNFEIHDSTAMH